MEFDAYSVQPCIGLPGLLQTLFIVADEFFWGSMDGHPSGIQGEHDGIFSFVWNFHGGLPPCASVHEVEDDMFPNEYQVAFDLCVEGICKNYGCDVGGAWFHPFSAHGAGRGDGGYEVQDPLGNPNTFQELLHCVF